jgi:transcriptional regulator with PAS, ATPase and Fis domain
VILESWIRSRNYGLPFGGRLIKPPLQAGELQEQRRRLPLLEVAEPIMAELQKFTTGSGFISALADEEGCVVKLVGDKEMLRRAAEENHMLEGANRGERLVGTNGIGTALALGAPLEVFAGEHYYPLNARWVCSAAPIKDGQGRVIAVFCLTGLREKVSGHTLALTESTARAISRQMTLQQTLETVGKIRTQMKLIVETVPTGVMLLGRDQEILQINNRTAELLSKPAQEIIGRNFSDIFGRNTLDTDPGQDKIDGRTITAELGRRRLSLAMDMRRTGQGESVVTLEKAETRHKKLYRALGATAHFTFADIIGSSPAITSAVAMARIAAENDSKVLLTGESGTGKELFAQAIHNAGPRRDGPFIAVNCGALPRSLIESELFGYERGAFTGANSEGRAGKFELADGGTIFLDEIGDMPLDVQVTLLRALQNREVSRLGGKGAIRVDVRIIAATNRNLITAIAENTFRRDLYYRLNVFSIHVPSLRERSGDVRLLADYFLSQYALNAGKRLEGFSENAYRLLESQDWRGNVRELENNVEQAVYMANDGDIDVECLSRLVSGPGGGEEPFLPAAGLGRPRPEPEDGYARFPAAAPAKPDRQAAEKALARAEGNVKRAAGFLGVSRRTMYRKLRLFGIDHQAFRPGRASRGRP